MVTVILDHGFGKKSICSDKIDWSAEIVGRGYGISLLREMTECGKNQQD
jgi:hypothetical protein